MNSIVRGMGMHPEPRHEVSLKRSGVALPGPGAGRQRIAVPARRRSLPRVLAALRVRRPWSGPAGPDLRESAGRGVGPVAGAATRGVAFLVNR